MSPSEIGEGLPIPLRKEDWRDVVHPSEEESEEVSEEVSEEESEEESEFSYHHPGKTANKKSEEESELSSHHSGKTAYGTAGVPIETAIETEKEDLQRRDIDVNPNDGAAAAVASLAIRHEKKAALISGSKRKSPPTISPNQPQRRSRRNTARQSDIGDRLLKNAGYASADSFTLLRDLDAINHKPKSTKDILRYPEEYCGLQRCHLRALHNVSHEAAKDAHSKKMGHKQIHEIKQLLHEICGQKCGSSVSFTKG